MARRRGCGCGGWLAALLVAAVAATVWVGATGQAPALWDLVRQWAGQSQQPAATAPLATATAEPEPLPADQKRYDPRFRPAYGALSDFEQTAYQELLEALLAGQSGCSFSVPLTQDQANRVLQALRADQPEVFWLGEGTYTVRDDQVESADFELLATGDELQAQRDALDARVEQVTEGLAGLPVAQQEQAVLQALLGQVAYDPSAPHAGQSAYNALVDGRALCGGYARAFQLLMNALDVPCCYVSGEGEGGAFNDAGQWVSHAWNLVETEDGWYAVDPTWMQADLLDQSALNYRWFNGSAEQFSATHRRDEASQALPAEEAAPFGLSDALGATGPVLTLRSAGYEPDAAVSRLDDYQALVTQAARAGQREFQLVLVVVDPLASTIEAQRQQVVQRAVEALPRGGRLSAQTQTVPYDDQTLLVVEKYTLTPVG